MKKKRRIEITVETRSLVFRQSNARMLFFCSQCAATVQMLAPDEAAVLAQTSSRTIYRWVEMQRVHFLETKENRLLICPNSLTQQT